MIVQDDDDLFGDMGGGRSPKGSPKGRKDSPKRAAQPVVDIPLDGDMDDSDESDWCASMLNTPLVQI